MKPEACKYEYYIYKKQETCKYGYHQDTIWIYTYGKIPISIVIFTFLNVDFSKASVFSVNRSLCSNMSPFLAYFLDTTMKIYTIFISNSGSA